MTRGKLHIPQSRRHLATSWHQLSLFFRHFGINTFHVSGDTLAGFRHDLQIANNGILYQPRRIEMRFAIDILVNALNAIQHMIDINSIVFDHFAALNLQRLSFA